MTRGMGVGGMEDVIAREDHNFRHGIREGQRRDERAVHSEGTVNADVIALLGRELRWNQAAAEWQWRDGDVAIYAYKFGRVHSISFTRREGSFVRGLDAHGTSWPEAERAWHVKSRQEGFGDV